MAENRLNIIQVSLPENSPYSSESTRSFRTKEQQAKFERLWLLHPEQFDPLRNCMERERLERTWQLLMDYTSLKDKQTADLGCGRGIFSRRMRDAGAQVKAVDIAENALKTLQKEEIEHIHPQQDALPNTSLPDQHYDVVVCTEVIAHLYPDDYRLFFAELARVVRTDGYLICSSAIDIHSDGGVERLASLAQTEFDLLEEVVSYHALHLRLKWFFETPARFIEGARDQEIRQKEMRVRRGISRWWFRLNTIPPFIWMWRMLDLVASPFVHLLKNNRTLLLKLEKICRFMWDEAGISHYLFIAKRRTLKQVDPKDIPIERPRRKEIWS